MSGDNVPITTDKPHFGYHQLIKFTERFTRLEARVEALEKIPPRVDTVEDAIVASAARGDVYRRVLDALWALLLALIAAGVWLKPH